MRLAGCSHGHTHSSLKLVVSLICVLLVVAKTHSQQLEASGVAHMRLAGFSHGHTHSSLKLVVSLICVLLVVVMDTLTAA